MEEGGPEGEPVQNSRPGRGPSESRARCRTGQTTRRYPAFRAPGPEPWPGPENPAGPRSVCRRQAPAAATAPAIWRGPGRRGVAAGGAELAGASRRCSLGGSCRRAEARGSAGRSPMVRARGSGLCPGSGVAVWGGPARSRRAAAGA